MAFYSSFVNSPFSPYSNLTFDGGVSVSDIPINFQDVMDKIFELGNIINSDSYALRLPVPMLMPINEHISIGSYHEIMELWRADLNKELFRILTIALTDITHASQLINVFIHSMLH